jgi:xanthine dehydrogenase accessory factor
MLGSVTIGGCVDAQVIEHAEDVLATHIPRLITLPLGDEEAWEIGLSCAGTLEVFIEPLATEHLQPSALYATLKAHVENGGTGALLTLLDGATAGAKLLLLDTGTRLGSLGSAGLNDAALDMARAQITQGTSRTVSFCLPEARARIFIEVHSPPATLIIVGAGHVAMPLVRMAHTVGWRTLVVDSRPRFATPERFPDADALCVGIPSEIVQTLPLTPSTAVILVAHDYKFDLPVLRHVLTSPVGYIGMLGGRQRGQAILKLLRQDGVSDAALQRVRVPIGLDLGSRSVPEIALAILAEVVSVRHGGSNVPLSQKGKA